MPEIKQNKIRYGKTANDSRSNAGKQSLKNQIKKSMVKLH